MVDTYFSDLLNDFFVKEPNIFQELFNYFQ